MSQRFKQLAINELNCHIIKSQDKYKMNKQLLIDNDEQQSNYSFDSSQISSSLSKTASVKSNKYTDIEQQVNKQIFMTPLIKSKSNKFSDSQKTQSIEKPRLLIQSQKHYYQQQLFGHQQNDKMFNNKGDIMLNNNKDKMLKNNKNKIFDDEYTNNRMVDNDKNKNMFNIGFVMGKNKKNVLIGQSKIKKGRSFFGDDQQQYQSFKPYNNYFSSDINSKQESIEQKESLQQLLYPNNSLFQFRKNREQLTIMEPKQLKFLNNNYNNQNSNSGKQDNISQRKQFINLKSQQYKQQKQQIHQYSVPCFININKKNNMNKNKNKIQIFDNKLIQKGKHFFNDDFNDNINLNKIKQHHNIQNSINYNNNSINPHNNNSEMNVNNNNEMNVDNNNEMNIFPSLYNKERQIQQQKDEQQQMYKKPTKVKKNINNIKDEQQNYIKTINVNKFKKRQKIINSSNHNLLLTKSNINNNLNNNNNINLNNNNKNNITNLNNSNQLLKLNNNKYNQLNKNNNKKQLFNWNQFEINQKLLFNISNHNNSHNTNNSSLKQTIHKKSSNLQKTISNTQNIPYSISKNKPINKTKTKPKIIFQHLNLDNLSINQFKNQSKLLIFNTKKLSLSQLTFIHQIQYCQILKCILCDLLIKQSQLNFSQLQQIFSSKLILQKIDILKFTLLYHQICFKLLKYQTFYPQILNKKLNPNNILIEMHKKSKILQAGSPFMGWLDFCIKQSKFYHSFIAEVRQIYHNQKIKTYFILLSDGWTNIWAVITERNYLYTFIWKLNTFSKIFVGYWKFYSLANILDFCPMAKQQQKCIEIWYNSTIIVKQNCKIGKSNKLIFYRPLNLNRKEGGIIPTVQGIILRLFCPSISKQKSYSSNSQQNSFNQNYIEIITPQGYTMLVRFILPSDRSLAELFRLYFKYHFYFLKIGQKDGILQFNDEVSKFYEFEKKDRNIYDKQLIDILKKRYVNMMNGRRIIQQLKIGNCYDVRLEGTQGLLYGSRFIIENTNQTETTNSSIKGGAYLYQQYELDRIEKIKDQIRNEYKMQYYLKKSRYSNTMKSLPTIYQKLNQLMS